MHAFGEGFRQAVGQRAQQDGGVIVLGGFEALDVLFLADAGGDDKAADIIRHADRGDEIGQAPDWGGPASRAICWRKVCSVAMGNFRALSP